MQAKGSTIFIVEDDQSVRDALGLLLGLRGHPVFLFADAESFLKAYRTEWRGCLLLDIRMPGMDGLALQKRLLETGCKMPVIVMTGHGNVESARAAFRARAVDFLEKPIDHGKLMSAIEEAFIRQAAAQNNENRNAEAELLLGRLTPREREVMELVVTGRHNKEIAEALGISARTVEVHKARLMTKLCVEGIPDLVLLSLAGSDKNHV
jgi:RNA polymerase sigma factor (sigma-70 family)